jgi:hypothetical protein
MSITPASSRVKDAHAADGFADSDEEVGLDPEISLVPLIPGQPFELRIPPASAIDKGVRRLRREGDAHGTVDLDDDTLARICSALVDPAVAASPQITAMRVDGGYVAIFHAGRMLTTLLNLTPANDRLLTETRFAADPSASGTATLNAVALPVPHPTMAALVYSGDITFLANATDRSFDAVVKDNPQEVGARIVERPVTVVVTVLGDGSVELCTEDGNSRLASALRQLEFDRDLLPSHLRSRVTTRRTVLRPSLLMAMTATERKELARRILRACNERLARPRVAGSGRAAHNDRRERNEAACAINALTVPVDIVLGYIDDDSAGYGNRRFSSAMRSLLVSMNVAPKPFDDGAKSAVRAEEIALALHAARLVTDSTCGVLLGRERERVAEGMAEYGVADLPDLRFAAVVWELTHNNRTQRRIIREKLQVSSVTTTNLNGPAVELGLRSFSSSLEPAALRQARTAFDSGSLWQGLITKEWGLYDIPDAEGVDWLEDLALGELRAGGDLGDAQTFLTLIGMVNLVSRGHLLAPGGSAEELVGGAPIKRSSIGVIVSDMAATEWGIRTLADAVRQARLGSGIVRWVDEEDGELVETSMPGAQYSARLRYRVQPDRSAPAPTPALEEEQAWLRFTDELDTLAERLEDFTNLRAEHGNVTLLPWGQVEGAMRRLTRISSEITRISEAPEEEW